MLEDLYAEGVIPDEPVNHIVCDAVRRNCNRAVHEFLDSNATASSMFEPLCRLCRAVHLGDFSFAHGGGNAVGEPELVYHYGGGWHRSTRFFNFMTGMRMATDDEIEKIINTMGVG